MISKRGAEEYIWIYEEGSQRRRPERIAYGEASWCLFLATCYWGDPIKKDEMGGTCRIHGREVRHVACIAEKRLWLRLW